MNKHRPPLDSHASLFGRLNLLRRAGVQVTRNARFRESLSQLLADSSLQDTVVEFRRAPQSARFLKRLSKEKSFATAMQSPAGVRLFVLVARWFSQQTDDVRGSIEASIQSKELSTLLARSLDRWASELPLTMRSPVAVRLSGVVARWFSRQTGDAQGAIEGLFQRKELSTHVRRSLDRWASEFAVKRGTGAEQCP
ncbi:MAG: hypothetical protein M3463_19565 [Verrucomicrobiota bacterium]|nr:hypothetical protein [Verrucomicrobiota bacterium]